MYHQICALFQRKKKRNCTDITDKFMEDREHDTPNFDPHREKSFASIQNMLPILNFINRFR